MVTPLDVRVAGATAAAANTLSIHRCGPQGGYTFEQEVFRALEGTHVWEHCAGPDHFDMALDLVGKSGTRYEFDGAFLSGDTLYVIEAKKVGVLARQHVGIFVQKLLVHGFSSPWHCRGGWALDVYLGRVTRIHHDLDVALSHADQLALQQCITARSRGGRTSSGWPRIPHRSILRSASGAISSARHAIIWPPRRASSSTSSSRACESWAQLAAPS